MVIQCQIRRSREYMAKTVVAAQHHDPIDFWMSTGRAVWCGGVKKRES